LTFHGDGHDGPARSIAEEVETEVTKKVEEAVNTIGGLTNCARLREGISQVFVTFILERDGDEAAQDVRDRVGVFWATFLGRLTRQSLRKSILTHSQSCRLRFRGTAPRANHRNCRQANQTRD
jgi:multidrug efflux pump subunit AcrB